MRRTVITPLATAVAFAMALTACSDSPEVAVAPPPPPPPPRAVTLAIIPSSLDLRVGESADLIHRALDSLNRVVTTVVEWSSDHPDIATIGRTDGRVTGIAEGAATITASAGTLSATALVTVRLPIPTTIKLSTTAVILAVGGSERVLAQVFDQDGRLMNAPITWSSENPLVASVSSDGTVAATGAGTTIVRTVSGAAVAEVSIRVEAADFLLQWASGAAASSQYYDTGSWAAAQATGAPNVANCNDEWRAWASLNPNGEEWLELTYDQPVRPTEIRIYEVYAPGSIVKVEVKESGGSYRQVYSATPQPVGSCLRTLVIPITGVTEFISTVRISLDQRPIADWNEIDAVRLTGFRKP